MVEWERRKAFGGPLSFEKASGKAILNGDVFKCSLTGDLPRERRARERQHHSARPHLRRLIADHCLPSSHLFVRRWLTRQRRGRRRHITRRAERYRPGP
ncbi:hypothetical protein EVAR_54858_1 [Eumeta japonica]|uniref:Uncharacterized protein n=1 Tax=Eumeta variegata TaxID=151549 RepID=A0A4C1YCI9_EUMVA|nr:hypothetical protein EVAR_54858_1 [Eumeta japonica]